MSDPKNNPLISIALCVYNGDSFLKEQLDSLLNQSYKNIEIIAADDCSTDSSWDILKEYQTKFSNFTLIRNKQNLGYSKNFERALYQCNGDFIALCDQDDIWHREKLKLQLSHISDHQLVYHDSAFIDVNGVMLNQKISDVINLYNGDNPKVFLFFNCVSGHSCFFRKELLHYILPFSENYFHDHWIAYVAANLGTVYHIPECLVYYRQHINSTTDILNNRRIKDKNYHENRDINKLEKDLKWLKHCKNFSKNKDPKLINKLTKLFENRLHSYSSLRYAFLIFQQYHILYFIQKRRKSKKYPFIYRQIWGLKAKLIWNQLFGNRRT
jgi:glycosyltransferase involved in cell wall biosynthesis